MEQLLSSQLFLSAIRLTIPLALAALGTTIIEKSGVINLGVEGVMLFGAFFAVLGSHLTGSPFIGMLFAIVIGAILGLLYAVLTLHFNANQSVTGIGLNVFATGFTLVLTRLVWGTEGLSGSVTPMPSFSIPVLSEIPILSLFFKDQSIYFYITIALVIGTWWFLYKMKHGLRLRAIGLHSRAAETVGIPVEKYRYIAITVSCILCSLGGSYLSIVQNSRFVNDMVAGRGFMAIAANIFGGEHPVGSLLASFIFAFAQALRINIDVNIPDQMLQMLPYVLTLVVLFLMAIRKKVARRKMDKI